MAEEVIRTFDVYNTTVLLPGYTISGYENEFGLTRGFYSTDYSSNPIGSKIDFFTQLDDPCTGILNPNPVFNVPVGLSGLDPLWFDQWWDEASYYSHPKVVEQLQTTNPSTYQQFSGSVGTLYYTASVSTPINPNLNNKVPKNILDQFTRLNRLINVDYNAYTPTSFGPNTSKLTAQLAQYTNSVTGIKNAVNNKFASINRKLPLNVVQKGNLVTPESWNFNTTIQGVNAKVDRLGNVISAPGRTLAGAINKVKSKIPVIKLPQLPSVGKLVNAALPNMPAASNLYNNLKTATSQIQSTVSIAQGTLATAQGAIAAAKNTIGGIQSAVSSAGALRQLGTNTAVIASPLSNINQTANRGTVLGAIKNQYPNIPVGLNNNAVIVVNKASKTTKGENSVTPVSVFDYKKP